MDFSGSYTINPFNFTEKTVVFFDLDGTTMELLHDPSARRVDHRVIKFSNQFVRHFPDQVIPITARDSQQVLVCFGLKDNPLTAETKLPHPAIASNGAELMLTDGRIITYPFKKEEKDFISYAKDMTTSFAKQHPWLVVEAKTCAFGFHSTLVKGYDCSQKGGLDAVLDNVRQSSEEAKGLIHKLYSIAKKEDLNFRMCSDEQTHLGITFAGVNKLDAISIFKDHLPTIPRDNDWSHVVYCGDSFLPSFNGHPEGNDRKIAQKVRELGGKVIQVTNDVEGNLPPEGDTAEPHFAFKTPNELGWFLHKKGSDLLKRKNLG